MKYFSSALVLFLFISCNSIPDLEEEFPCVNPINYTDLKKSEDVRHLFSVQFPKKWKVNLYYDAKQTSIHAADTTLNLTKATIMDITLIHTPIFLDETFKQKITADNKKMQLFEIKTNAIKLFEKPTYYSYAEGKKNNYSYHILNTFTKVNSDNFLHVKTEIYGDLLVDERICKAIKLINKIQLK